MHEHGSTSEDIKEFLFILSAMMLLWLCRKTQRHCNRDTGKNSECLGIPLKDSRRRRKKEEKSEKLEEEGEKIIIKM